MATKAKAKTTDAAPKSSKAPTRDSFQNLQAALGIGSQNLLSQSFYGFNPITRFPLQLEWMYRGSWLSGMAVDAVAKDMTRAGIELETDLDPAEKDLLESAILDLRIWRQLRECIKWGRLYGGALGYIMIDGQKPETPLKIDSIAKDQFKGIMPLNRWQVSPTLMDVINDFGPDWGNPKFYEVVQNQPGLPWIPKIHYSRMIRFIGIDLPFQQKLTENGWGESVLERIYDILVAHSSTSTGAAQLVYKAHLRIMKIDGLREIIAAGGPAMAGITAMLNNLRLTQSSEGLTLLDKDDDFETQTYTFSGLDTLLLQFGQQISGALQIPLVRLFGQSPAGLNSTGESDLRTYYDNVAEDQEDKLRHPLNLILDILSRSALEKPLPPGFKFRFRPLWLVRDTEKAQIATQTTDTVTKAFESGLISQSVALKELKQSSHVTGVFSNISDEDIEDADEKPPKATEIPSDPGQSEGSEGQI
ncbi:MAG: DUF1073 domain-containing protein [Nitrospirota bacterium]|nr:DUF1073 domain-containing protein [Nitrospirota bacterium]